MRLVKGSLFSTLLASSPVLLQLGCFNPSDFRYIAEGQLISFVNALISSVTSDAIRGVIGT